MADGQIKDMIFYLGIPDLLSDEFLFTLLKITGILEIAEIQLKNFTFFPVHHLNTAFTAVFVRRNP